MFVYMGMIEQRINELLQARIYIQSKGKIANSGLKMDDSSEEEDVEQMPLFNPEGDSERENEEDDDDVDLFSAPLN